jgi:hypothetical protein
MIKKLQAVLLLAGLSLGLVTSANAVPMFARMYSYSCSTCHAPGYGQLNKFGYNFRAAGYRIPKDIGKVQNDGKFDFGNYSTARFSAGGTLKTSTQPSNVPIPDSATFTLGGASLYLGGGVSKNFFVYSEFGLGNGTGVFPGTTPSLSSAKVGYVTGTEDEFFTVRLGKFSSDGYGGSDRGPIGTPSITSAVKPTGTGLELGYTNHDTRVTVAFWNGIQNATLTDLYDKGAPVTTSSLQAPSSDTNNAKDIQIFVNQFIGDDGLAINATFYNGFNDSLSATGGTNANNNPDWAGQEFYNTALFLSVPVVKNLEFKTGIERGQTNTGIFSTTSTAAASEPAGGFFGEVTYEADEVTPIVARFDYTTTDQNVQYTDTMKITVGALTPLAEGDVVYMNPTFSATLTDKAPAGPTPAGYAAVYQWSDSLYLFI